ncbi:uncharacterized protein LOC141907812 isoform X2 [Tubulanus polymorphus]|uniref:uncharacterized protein LOC141907812 isoform X2 n=1 Tax=Tubulanus polymorphus TaxID=672921 RepID=UPI003DA5BA2F
MANLIVILDSAELLIDVNCSHSEAVQFMEILSTITQVRNHKVKIIMTSLMNPWQQQQQNVPCGIENRIPVHKLEPLSLNECSDLLKKMVDTKQRAAILDSTVCSTIAQRCGRNSLVIRVVGSYLKDSSRGPMEINQFIERLIHNDHRTSMVSILENLDKSKQDLLIQLSVFENNQFDYKAAIHVTGHDGQLMKMELDELYTRSLLEVRGSRASDSFNSAQGESFSLHILVTTSLRQLSLTDQQNDLLNVSNLRLIDYGRILMLKLGKLSCSRALQVTKRLADDKQYLMKYLENIKKFTPSIPDLRDKKEFCNYSYANMLMDWFLEPERRADYFFHLAKAASTTKPLTLCMMLLWYAEQYFEGHLFDPYVVRLVLKKVDKTLKKLEKKDISTSGKSTDLCRALYLYVQGRFFDRIGRFDEGIVEVKKALKIHSRYLLWNVLKARDLNLLGHLYLNIDDPAKAVKYYDKSCIVMQEIAAKNDKSDLHFDTPNYMMNTGSAYLVLGNHDCYAKEKCKSDEQGHKLEVSMKKRYDEAIKYFDRALQCCETLGMKSTLLYGRILKNKACALAELEDPDEALRTLNKSSSLFKNLVGGEQRMKFFYMRGTIKNDLGKRALENKTGDHVRHYTDAESDFAQAYKLLLHEGNFMPCDQFIPKLLRDYKRTLSILGKDDESKAIEKEIQDLKENSSKQTTMLPVPQSGKKLSHKRKMSDTAAISNSKKLRKDNSLELDDSELINPEPLVASSANAIVGETEADDKPVGRRIMNWLRKSFSFDNSAGDSVERAPGLSNRNQADVVPLSNDNSSNTENSSDDDSTLRGIDHEPFYTEDSSSYSSCSDSSFKNVAVDFDSRLNEEIYSWAQQKQAACEWLNQIEKDAASSCSDDSF